MSMGGTEDHLFPYLPAIVQDLWELGTIPEGVIALVKKHVPNWPDIKVLDLGCGKGAVSIRLAKELKCQCHGIDAVKAFIEEAKTKAKEFNVETHCFFEWGDIRTRIKDLKGFDVVILGSIGPVLGDYYSTLTQLSDCVKTDGYIIIDDAYMDEKESCSNSPGETRSGIMEQAAKAGMKLIDEVIIDREKLKRLNESMYSKIKKRCLELIALYPEKKRLFIDFLRRQEDENKILEEKVVCSTMLFGK